MAFSASKFTDQITKDRRSSDLERTDPSRILLATEVQVIRCTMEGAKFELTKRDELDLVQHLIVRGGVCGSLEILPIFCQGRRQKTVAKYRSHGVGEGAGPSPLEDCPNNQQLAGPCLRHLSESKAIVYLTGRQL
jgi:hypothetical protein